MGVNRKILLVLLILCFQYSIFKPLKKSSVFLFNGLSFGYRVFKSAIYFLSKSYIISEYLLHFYLIFLSGVPLRALLCAFGFTRVVGRVFGTIAAASGLGSSPFCVICNGKLMKCLALYPTPLICTENCY